MCKIKSKKVGIFSDLHLGLSQDSSIWHETALNFGEWASKKFESLGISEIFIPGDIFHNRSDISLKTIDVAKKFFDLFKDFHLYISVGNHDCMKKDTSDIHSVVLLSEWKNITVIDKEPVVFSTNFDKTVSFIPWATDVSKIPISDICFGHFDIQTFYMNGYSVCEKGFSSDDLFNKSKIIVSGHFHKKQERVYKNGKIVYVGSCFQHNFGDVGDERGIHIFDIETEEFQFIENTKSPKHIKIKISDILQKKINSNTLKSNVPNNIIKLVIDSDLDYTVLSTLIGKIKNLNPISFQTEYFLPEKEKIIINDESVEEISDFSEILKNYIDSMDVENKDQLKKYLLNLYKTFY